MKKKKKFKRHKAFKPQETFEQLEYTPEEMEAVEEHIRRHFGSFEGIVHDQNAQKLHVDVIVVPPDKKQPYWKLVTMGMGKYRMDVPQQEGFNIPDRIELVLNFEPNEEFNALFSNVTLAPMGQPFTAHTLYNVAWPVELLKQLAALPIESDTFLAPMHTVDFVNTFSKDTALCGVLIKLLDGDQLDGEICTLPDGEEVCFYTVVPIYRDEMEYLLESDIEGKAKLLQYLPNVTEATRPDALENLK